MSQKIFYIFILLFSVDIYSQSVESNRHTVENQIIIAGKLYQENQFEESLEHSKRALISALKMGDDELIAQAYNSIGVIYEEFSQTSRAIEFYEKALDYADNVKNDTLLDWINSNLGSVYYYNNIDIKKGIDYYKQSLYHAEKIKDSFQISYSKLNLANAYFADQKFKTGIKYLKESENYILEKGDNESKFYLWDAFGIYYSNSNEEQKSLDYFFKARDIVINDPQNRILLPNVYKNISDHYYRFNNQDLAEFYKKEELRITDSIFSNANYESLENTALKIQLNEYINQFEKIELDNQKKLKKEKETNIITVLLAIILCIFLILTYTLYKANLIRKKINTKLLRVNENLKKAKSIAEENSKMKSQFVSTVSHELRTPLYGVVGITQMIIDEQKDQIDNNQLKSLNFSAKYLLALVNDLLQINTIEGKKIILQQNVFNLREVINTINNSLIFFAENNNNRVEIEFDDKVPVFLQGDDLRLSQILMNLMSNALKFTNNGTVRLEVKLVEQKNKHYHIEFKVKDNGIGISKENQKKIFEKFIQLERKKSDYQGTGLGLAIVMRLIELFDSKIELDSKKNQGSCFSFIIKFQGAKDPFVSENKIFAKEKTTNSNLNVLIVEDNKINQMVTKKIVERNQYKCVIAENGMDAIELIKQQHFDIILMDINMPVMDGFETSKIIREMEINTPIIALTAFESNEVLNKISKSGINDIIMKPFQPTDLYESMEREMKQNIVQRKYNV